MKYFFETYGCQMNLAESAALSLAARERGWEEAESGEEANLVLINTCSVRATAEQRVFGRLAHYAARKKKVPVTLVVAGCMAQRHGSQLLERGADYVMGTFAREKFPLILEAVEQGHTSLPKTLIEINEKPEFTFSAFHHDTTNPYRSFVPIMHGCDNFCSYCVVPYLRGREVSRSPTAILEEIRLLAEKGVREITLLGQNVNSWCFDSMDFPGLLRLIAYNIRAENLLAEKQQAENNRITETGGNGIRWVRFLSSHPKDFSPEAIEVLAENSCYCRHIHLPVQSGSNRVLKAMNRQYTRQQYLELVSRLRSAIPEVSLSTDILVGFPGETEEELDETLSLMEEVKFLYAYMYHYNPREGTAAFTLPGRISREIKGRRLSRVIELQKRHTVSLLQARIGMEVTVLIEGISRKNADELVCRTGS
ncbi:MAG: tRNA (N6-isopentenyl adenosine(37)-C2)-methylthiotransferase MiaB, partial [Treponema sp.]|nr:tRNA (N6-isopentenyl adenosine(37)-C2)-methylthiotransferase MiaB [Treponema sp.]